MTRFSPKTISIAFMLVSVSLFAAISLIAKTLGTGLPAAVLHPTQVSAGRFCFAFMVIAPIFFAKKPGFSEVPWGLHFARSAAGWLGITCMFMAAISIPLADANAISFLSVIITMGLSVIMLGERVGPRRWFAALLALIGAIILVRPGSEAFHPAAIFALLAALFIGLEAIFVKQLSNTEPPLRILFINNAIGAVLSLSLASFFWQFPSQSQWISLAVIGIAMILTQACFIQAISRMDASFITPFWYAVPLFAALYDWQIFGQWLSTTSIVGIGLISLGGIVICRRS